MVVALPEDMLVDQVEVADVPRVEPADTWPNPAEMARLRTLLEQARSPLVILGGSRWTETAREKQPKGERGPFAAEPAPSPAAEAA